MTAEQLQGRIGLIQKATGWFIVAAGASCLAIQETWRLFEDLGWPPWLIITALIIMFSVTAAGSVLSERLIIAGAG